MKAPILGSSERTTCEPDRARQDHEKIEGYIFLVCLRRDFGRFPTGKRKTQKGKIGKASRPAASVKAVTMPWCTMNTQEA